MSACDDVKTRIPDFPGYSGELDRRQADEMIRSYAGERVSEMEERLQPLDGALADACAATLMRTGFVNQEAFKDFEYASMSQGTVDSLCDADLALLALADRAAGTARDGAIAYLTEIGTALDRREQIMIAAGKESPG